MRYFLAITLLITLFACEKYNDYEVNSIGFTATYFPEDTIFRSAVAGEGLTIKVGAYLGGVRENLQDHSVQYIINDTMLDSSNFTLLPEEYYTLSDPNEIIIPKGSYQGLITISFDSLSLANDLLFMEHNYALPFYIISTSADSILENYESTIIPIKVMNTYEGYFYSVGQIDVYDSVGGQVDTIIYGDALNFPQSPVRFSKSIMMDSVIVDGIGDRGGANYSMKLRIHTDNSVDIIPMESSIYQVAPNGSSTWNPVNRVFNLNYKYKADSQDFLVSETLTFRNRVRDGIDEWRWKGFPGN